MDKQLKTFLMIMCFYILLSYLVGPIIGYYASNKNLQGAGHGFAAASIVSVILWYSVGKNKI